MAERPVAGDREVVADAGPRAHERRGPGAKQHEADGRRETLLDLKCIGIRFGGLQALEGCRYAASARRVRRTDRARTAPARPRSSPSSPACCGRQAAASRCPAETAAGQPLHRSAGMARTFQHVQLVPTLSVIDNVALGAYWRTSAGFMRGLLALDDAENRACWRAPAVLWPRRASWRRQILPPAACRSASSGSSRSRAPCCADPQILLLDEPAAGLRFRKADAREDPAPAPCRARHDPARSNTTWSW